VILFREEHSPRTLVQAVDFITAAGTSPPGEFRPGGPYALVTGLCVFHFDRATARFTLTSTHPGVTPSQVRAATGFAYDEPAAVPTTAPLTPSVVNLLRQTVAAEIATTYPAFAAATWP
jgi:glutaconate CoA-transferase, subunit B